MCLVSCYSALQAQDFRWQMRTHYHIKVKLDPSKNLLSGDEDVILFNGSNDTLKSVYFHLYWNAFQPGSDMDVRSRWLKDSDKRIGDRIQKLQPDEIGYQKIQYVRQFSNYLKFKIEGTIMELSLAQPLMPHDSIILKLGFEAQIPIQIRRSGRNNKEGIDYSMAQWYPKICNYDEQGWHTPPYIAREFYAPWGNFEVEIELPDVYCVGATGYLVNESECKCDKTKSKNLNRVWKFNAPDVHDFVWAADTDYHHDTYETVDKRKLHFYYLSDQKYSQEWKTFQPIMERVLHIMEEMIGSYPYSSYSFIQAGDGGMEYPMATLITGNRSLHSLVGVSIHEFVHSWFQMVLASNESLYHWMDEGFTSYFEEEVINKIKEEGLIPDVDPKPDPHQETLLDWKGFAGSELEEPMITHADHFKTNAAYGKAAYVKGALLLHQLRYIIGDATFWTGMRTYYQNWSFKHPNPNDFFRIMEKESGIELDWFKEYWIHSTKTIDYGISEVEEKSSETYITLSRNSDFPMPIDLLVLTKDSAAIFITIPLDLMRKSKVLGISSNMKALAPWHWVSETYEFKLPFKKEEIRYIVIDPTRMMADINESNDVWINEIFK